MGDDWMRRFVPLTVFHRLWRRPWPRVVITREMGTVPPAEASAHQNGDAPESTDFANYFCTYAFLYHQVMADSQGRSYYEAVMKNAHLFEGRTVLDVGTGSGILALFAAKAGARKVYAIEATDVARHARTLMQANKVDERVVVIQGTMESVELPEKVDVIISEWMGYFLLRESMIDSVLVARDKFLKPGGSLFPSHANMYLAPIRSHGTYHRLQEYQGAMAGWDGFTRDMQEYYGVNMHCLTKHFEREQHDYYRCTAQWSEVHPQQLLAPPIQFKSYDLLTVTLDEVKAPLIAEMQFEMHSDGKVDALCGFFDVTFAGSPRNPARCPVTLSTAPEMGPCTHWGQLSFYLFPQLICQRNERLPLSVKMTRRSDNHRLMNLHVAVQNRRQNKSGPIEYNFFIE